MTEESHLVHLFLEKNYWQIIEIKMKGRTRKDVNFFQFTDGICLTVNMLFSSAKPDNKNNK